MGHQQQQEDERKRLAKLVDSWSTKEQRLAELEAERQHKEWLGQVVGVTVEEEEDNDVGVLSAPEKKERLRLAKLVHDWSTGKGWTTMIDHAAPPSLKEQDYVATLFDVPDDYEPTCLSRQDNDASKAKSSGSSNNTRATCDGPRLTFASSSSRRAKEVHGEKEERARLALLVSQWDLSAEAKDDDLSLSDDENKQDNNDRCYSSKEREELARLQQKVNEWSTYGGLQDEWKEKLLKLTKSTFDNNDPSSEDEEEFVTTSFDVPDDYEPTCLSRPEEDVVSSDQSSTKRDPWFSPLDGPRLTFAASKPATTVAPPQNEKEERARLASLVSQWDVPAAEKDDVLSVSEDEEKKEQYNDDDHYYSLEEREERARLQQKVNEWSSYGGLDDEWKDDLLKSTSATFDNDMSEDEVEGNNASQETVTTAEDEERLRLAKMVDEWTIGVGSYEVKNQKGDFPVYSFDDILQDDMVIHYSAEEEKERGRLAKMVDDWTGEQKQTTSSSVTKTDPWERFQRMMQAENAARQKNEKKVGRGACSCVRIVPHRQPALLA